VIKAEFSALLLQSLQCHTILQKSLKYEDLMIKKHIWLLSILKTVHIFVEIVMHFIFQDS